MTALLEAHQLQIAFQFSCSQWTKSYWRIIEAKHYDHVMAEAANETQSVNGFVNLSWNNGRVGSDLMLRLIPVSNNKSIQGQNEQLFINLQIIFYS